MTRNPTSDIANKWEIKGVEMVKGDLDDVASLRQAFVGADIIFGVTDVWTIFKDLENYEKMQPGQSHGF